MALSQIIPASPGQRIDSSNYNAEFNNIYNNALSLISPLTGTLNFNNNFATNLRLEVQSATQSVAASGRVYFQSTEQALHVDTGTVMTRGPLLSNFREGRLVGITNPTGVSGATVYSQITLGTGLSLSGTTLSSTASGGDPIQSAVFN